MIERIMISGSGGDGAVFLGKTLSWAAMCAGRGYYTTGLPSYGPEIRGGTSRTEVIISDASIGSPVNTTFESLIVFNDMSLDRFEPGIVPGGLCVYNADVVTRAPRREDVTALVEGLRHVARHPKLFELNCAALDRGIALARERAGREAALAHR